MNFKTIFFFSLIVSQSSFAFDLQDFSKISPSSIVDMAYFTKSNFLGEKVSGYKGNKCLLLPKAVRALAAVQAELNVMSLQLRIFDCYRPQKAVDHFMRWVADADSNLTKKDYYPDLTKQQLIDQEYIAVKSGHSRGSTVDLTINGLDMGSKFDFFGKQSNTAYPEISTQQKANRLLLKFIMHKHGFENYSKEWWHYTLKNEENKDRYLNVDVE